MWRFYFSHGIILNLFNLPQTFLKFSEGEGGLGREWRWGRRRGRWRGRWRDKWSRKRNWRRRNRLGNNLKIIESLKAEAWSHASRKTESTRFISEIAPTFKTSLIIFPEMNPRFVFFVPRGYRTFSRCDARIRLTSEWVIANKCGTVAHSGANPWITSDII